MRALARALVALPRLLDTDLVETEGLSLTEYLVLSRLSEAPGRRLRMSELAAASHNSLSGTTRVVDRLARHGWVQRLRCADDGRGAFASLTDDGFTRLQRAYPTHLASVRRHVFDNLSGVDQVSLAASLNRIGAVAASACAPDPACPGGPR